MKITTILLAGVLIAALALTGCQSRKDDGVDSSAPEDTGSSSSSEAVAGDPVDEERLTTALEGVSQYEPGTAGSSLKVYIAAAQLLNFTETYEEGQGETLRTAVEDYFAALDPQQLQQFADNLIEVDITAREIISGEREGTLERLEEAGSPQEQDNYTLSKYEAVKTLLDEQLMDRE